MTGLGERHGNGSCVLLSAQYAFYGKVTQMYRFVSMRDLFRSDPDSARALLAAYYPELEKAFPLPGEIETTATYERYLLGETLKWNMLVIVDDDDSPMGGVQLQVLSDVHPELGSVAWIEHVWLRIDKRSYPVAREILYELERYLVDSGAQHIFMEFNDPWKMTPEEIEEDQKAGLATNDRLILWSRLGLCELHDELGEVAPYAQPGMDGEDPVEYLSVGMMRVDGSLQSLDGEVLSAEAYRALVAAAHRTLPGYDEETDPTAQKLRQMLHGHVKFTFVPLSKRFE